MKDWVALRPKWWMLRVAYVRVELDAMDAIEAMLKESSVGVDTKGLPTLNSKVVPPPL